MKLKGLKMLAKKIPIISLCSSHSGLYLHVSVGKIYESQGGVFSLHVYNEGTPCPESKNGSLG